MTPPAGPDSTVINGAVRAWVAVIAPPPDRMMYIDRCSPMRLSDSSSAAR